MTNNDTIARRIRQIRHELCHNDNTEFARHIGKSRQHASALCSGKSAAGRRSLDLILQAFPNVNPEWLLLGNGTMLSDTPTTHNAADIYADIADHFSHLSHLFNRLASCVSPSES